MGRIVGITYPVQEDRPAEKAAEAAVKTAEDGSEKSGKGRKKEPEGDENGVG